MKRLSQLLFHSLLLSCQILSIDAQFDENYAEVRNLLNEIRIASIKKHGSFSDFDPTMSLARQHIKPATFDDGTEATANRDIADNLFENDILLTLPQAKAILEEVKTSPGPVRRLRPKRQAAPALSTFWTTLRVPFIFQYSDISWQNLIRSAQRHIETQTCVRFYEATTNALPRDYLQYVRGAGCWSSVGRVGGRQQISIGYGCDALGVVAHETLHALGLWHEQSRTDRDNFVLISYNDIYPGTQSNFEKRTPANSDNMGQPYDLGSVMHYGSKAFSTDYSKYSVITRDSTYQQTIGQRVGISFKDAKMINLRYCTKICPTSLACQNGGYTDPNACSRCKCPDGYAGTYCQQIPSSNVADCKGGEYTALTNKQYLLRSSNVVANANCYYRIKSDYNQRIEITVTQVSFPCKDVCGSYVELKYKNDKVPTGARLCCEPPKSLIISDGPEVLIIFKGAADVPSGYLGFQLTYRAVSASATTASSSREISSTTASTTSIVPATTVKPTGEWSKWAAWSVCSVSCGGCGVRRRVRACYGGNEQCSGLPYETESCGNVTCPLPSWTTRCDGRLLMPCELIRQLDFGTVLKGGTIFRDDPHSAGAIQYRSPPVHVDPNTPTRVTTKQPPRTVENRRRRGDPLKTDVVEENRVRRVEGSADTEWVLLMANNNARLLRDEAIRRRRRRRFVDSTKQQDPKVYCEKKFSYNCPTALLTISMDWNTNKASKSYDSRLCCPGYYSSGGTCYKQ